MDVLERAKSIAAPPPTGAPYSLPVPNSEQQGRSAVYRNWRFVDGLLKSLDPNVNTMHEAFERSAIRNPDQKCLGHRPYDRVKKAWGQYQWMTYGIVQKRRASIGVGLVEVNKQAGIHDQRFGLGLWCQNRPEWQLMGKLRLAPGRQFLTVFRSCLHVSISLHGLPIRYPRAFSN